MFRFWCIAFGILGLGRVLTSTANSQSASNPTFTEWSAKAAAAREGGHPPEAIDAYQHAVELRPSWEEGWWYLGTLNYDAEHYVDAEKAFKRAVEVDPRLGPAWAFLGLCEFETKEFKSSFVHLQRARSFGFAQDPEVAKVALYHLALLLNVNSEFEKSSELLIAEFGSTVFPEQIKTALGLAFLRVPLLPNQVDPAKDAVIHAAGETAALLGNRKTEEAFASFEHMLSEYTATPYLHYSYGRALAAVGRYKDAELQFKQETEVTRSSPQAWTGLATVLIRQGRAREAEAAARHAVQLNPRLASSFEVLGHALQPQGKKAEAEAALEKARLLAGASIPADALQVKQYALNSKVEPPASKPASEEAARTEFAELSRRAEAAQATGNYSESAQLYQAALELRPEWAQGWRMVGTFHYMIGKFPEAITALKRAVTLDPRPPEAWTVLGLSEFETKDYTNSLLHLERGSEGGFGGNREATRIAKYHLAVLLNLNREFDRALSLLVPEVGAGPPSEDVQFVMGISLLRIAKVPDQISADHRLLVSLAGRAATLLSESRYDQAFPIFDQLIREHPDTPFLHFAYGAALASSSNYDRARAQLLEEARLNPTTSLPYVRLASISLVLHDPDQALQFAKKAVEIASDSAECHYVLGRSLLEKGDAAGAVGALETARRLAPSSPEVHFNLARAYTKTHRLEEAEQERAEFERLQSENLQNSAEGMGTQPPHSHDPMAGAAQTLSRP